MYPAALHSAKSKIDGQMRTKLFPHGYHEESTPWWRSGEARPTAKQTACS